MSKDESDLLNWLKWAARINILSSFVDQTCCLKRMASGAGAAVIPAKILSDEFYILINLKVSL